jgi:hypothetical protein
MVVWLLQRGGSPHSAFMGFFGGHIGGFSFVFLSEDL